MTRSLRRDAKFTELLVRKRMRAKLIRFAALFMLIVVFAGVGSGLVITNALATDGEQKSSLESQAVGEGEGSNIAPASGNWVVAAAAFVVAVGTMGASYAVAKVGSAALGAVSENPELFGRSLAYVGLAEGLAVFGLLIGIMLLGKL